MPGFAEFAPEVRGVPVPVTVPAAELSDIEAIVGIQECAGREVNPQGYRRSITDPSRCVLVAIPAAGDDDVPAAVAWAQTYHHVETEDPAPRGHYLGGVTVDPRWRRRGIAARLTQARMDWIGARASEAYYVVNPQNRASSRSTSLGGSKRWPVRHGSRASHSTVDSACSCVPRCDRATGDWPRTQAPRRTTFAADRPHVKA